MTTPPKGEVISIRISAEDLAVIDAEAGRAGMSRTALMVARAKAPDAGEAARVVAALETIQRRLITVLSGLESELVDAMDIAEEALEPLRKPKRKRKIYARSSRG